jgi:hypothetical protein
MAVAGILQRQQPTYFCGWGTSGGDGIGNEWMRKEMGWASVVYWCL